MTLQEIQTGTTEWSNNYMIVIGEDETHVIVNPFFMTITRISKKSI